MSKSAQLLYDGITHIDEELIEEAESYKPKIRTVNWTRWGALAASLVIVAAGAYGLFRLGTLNLTNQSENMADYEAVTEEAAEYSGTETTETTAEEPNDAVGETTEDAVEEAEEADRDVRIDLNNDIIYTPIRYKHILERFNISYDENDPEFIRLNNGDLTRDDLGEEMGEVTECNYAALIGCKVYHFAEMPDYDAVCIVEYPPLDGEEKYVFYVEIGSYNILPAGTGFDETMEEYGLPDSIIISEISNIKWRRTREFKQDNVTAFFELMKTKTSCGLNEFERVRDQAREQEDEDYNGYTIRLVTNRGYEIGIYYFPEMRIVSCEGGYYKLTETEAETLEQILDT